MRALTFHQPWLWSIVDGPKRVENRKWKPWPEVIGRVIALHAGKVYDASGAEYIRKCGIEPPGKDMCVQGAIVGVARVITWFSYDDMFWRTKCPPTQVQWFFGPYGWLLEDVRKLREPVPCKGALALWNVPPAIERAVLERVCDA